MNKINFVTWSVESAIRIGLIFLLLVVSFLIFKPFLVLIVWGMIIAVAFYPLHLRFTKLLKGKSKASALILTLFLLALLIIPATLFIGAVFDNASDLSNKILSGTLSIPPPPQRVSDWPLIGEPLYDLWQSSSNSLEKTIEKYGDQIHQFGVLLFGSIGGVLGGVLVFVLSIIVAGIFLVNSEGSYSFAVKLSEKLMGQRGKLLVDNSKATIQSVVKGVIGVALIQSILVGIGFWAAGIPAASLLTIIVFIFALMQLPPIIIVVPVIVYVFSVESTTVAIIFTIYELIAGASDNILKPILLGRGLEIPMMVILLGAIGGMILMGMIGLFIGSVILALAYQLFLEWLNFDKKEELSDAT